jgi:hypothetical protein
VDAWPYFPGLKVGQTFISLLPLRLFDGVDCQSLHFHSAAVDWLNCFLLPFLLTPLGLIKYRSNINKVPLISTIRDRRIVFAFVLAKYFKIKN